MFMTLCVRICVFPPVYYPCIAEIVCVSLLVFLHVFARACVYVYEWFVCVYVDFIIYYESQRTNIIRAT